MCVVFVVCVFLLVGDVGCCSCMCVVWYCFHVVACVLLLLLSWFVFVCVVFVVVVLCWFVCCCLCALCLCCLCDLPVLLKLSFVVINQLG